MYLSSEWEGRGPEDIAGVISFRFGDSDLYVSELVRPAPELLLCA